MMDVQQYRSSLSYQEVCSRHVATLAQNKNKNGVAIILAGYSIDERKKERKKVYSYTVMEAIRRTKADRLLHQYSSKFTGTGKG